MRWPWLLVWLVLCAPLRAEPLDIALKWQLAKDESGQWGVAEALRHREQFEPATPRGIAPGYTQGALWALLELPAEQIPEGDLRLSLRMPRLERVQLWQRSSDGSWLSQEAGLARHHSSWPLDTPSASFPLQRPAAGQPLLVLMRQTGRTAPSWDAMLCSPYECQREHALTDAVSMLVIGSQLPVAVCCVLLFLVWRQRSLLLLAAYALSYGLYESSQQGWSYQYLWPTAGDWATRSLNVQVSITLVLQSMCIASLLRGLSRPALLALQLSWLAQGLTILGSLFADYRAVAPFSIASNLLGTLLILGVTLWAWQRRLPQGGFIALVMGLTFVGAMPRYMHLFGWMSHGNPVMLTTPLFMLVTTLLMLWALIARLAELSRAQHQQHERSRLLAYVSHDLRTPLSATLGFVRGLRPGSREEQRLRASVEQGLTYQLALIDELVEFSRGEMVQMELLHAPVYFWSLLHEMGQQGELLAKAQGNSFGMQFSPALPPVLMTDAKRLRQLLLNLLSNASKFTRRGRIELHVMPSRERPQHLHFEVRDTGIGIAQQDQARMFEPFWRVASSASQTGSGLGLAIARHIAVAMGSPGIMVKSMPGEGSRFAFELAMPACSSDEVLLPALNLGEVKPQPPGTTVLLLDEPQAHADRMAELLFAADAEVQRCTQVQGSLQGVHILLCDPDLLDVKGRAAVRQWRLGGGRCIGLLSHPPAHPEMFDALHYKPVDAAALLASLEP